MSLFCLASPDQIIVPDTETKVNLLLAKLGEKRISFKLNEKSEDFMGTIKNEFPKLHNGGGLEILRTERNSKELILIPPPQEG